MLTNDICYSYLIWEYIKIFGKNSKNFQDIFQIIINYVYEEEINLNFNFPFDDEFLFLVHNYIDNIVTQKNNQL